MRSHEPTAGGGHVLRRMPRGDQAQQPMAAPPTTAPASPNSLSRTQSTLRNTAIANGARVQPTSGPPYWPSPPAPGWTTSALVDDLGLAAALGLTAPGVHLTGGAVWPSTPAVSTRFESVSRRDPPLVRV